MDLCSDLFLNLNLTYHYNLRNYILKTIHLKKQYYKHIKYSNGNVDTRCILMVFQTTFFPGAIYLMNNTTHTHTHPNIYKDTQAKHNQSHYINRKNLNHDTINHSGLTFPKTHSKQWTHKNRTLTNLVLKNGCIIMYVYLCM